MIIPPNLPRSLCTLVCKWNYWSGSSSGIGDKDEWSESFLKAIGLEDLLDDDAIKIGQEAREPGRPCSGGKNCLPNYSLHTAVSPSYDMIWGKGRRHDYISRYQDQLRNRNYFPDS